MITDFRELLFGWRAGHLYGTNSERQYSELWVRFWQAVADVGADQIEIEWVPSHLSHPSALELGVPLAYWHGNKQADYYARSGAAMHPRLMSQDHVRLLREATAIVTLKTVLRILRRCSLGKWADVERKNSLQGPRGSI